MLESTADRVAAAGMESAATRIETGLATTRAHITREARRSDQTLEDIRTRTAGPRFGWRTVLACLIFFVLGMAFESYTHLFYRWLLRPTPISSGPAPSSSRPCKNFATNPISPQTPSRPSDTLLNDHTRFQQAREHIQTYLTDVGQAWKQHQNLQEIAQEFSSQNIRLEDIDSYSQWKERALRLADAGEDIVADKERYGLHLDHRPDDAKRIRASVARLNAAIGRDEASIRRERRQTLSEDEKTAERRSQRHGIKL